jgi:IS5 family transposase
MRPKSDPAICFEWGGGAASTLKIVDEYREKYKRISEILDADPELLRLAHGDLEALSQGGRRGRRAKFTSENLFRALIVHRVEGETLRKTVVRIAESPFLQDFLRLGNRTPMDFTFLDRAFKAVRPETWKALNRRLATTAAEGGEIDPSAVRVDTTVVETTVHYPTDASLLWDAWRVLARLLRRGRDLAPLLCPHRFHDAKIKKLYLRIGRYGGSSSKSRKRYVKRCFRDLIERVGRLTGVAEGFCAAARAEGGVALLAVVEEIERFLPNVRTVLDTAERANLHGESVPARERVFSLFEPHTELIRRGKSGKPVEFGHAVLFSQTREKFVVDYEAMERKVADARLASVVVARHEETFGEPPEALTADGGFHPGAEERAELEDIVETFAVPERVSDWGDVLDAVWQKFRAGIEGTISVLKRAYRLFRCPHRGFKSFDASVGLGVFCHNLVLLARGPDG